MVVDGVAQVAKVLLGSTRRVSLDSRRLLPPLLGRFCLQGSMLRVAVAVRVVSVVASRISVPEIEMSRSHGMTVRVAKEAAKPAALWCGKFEWCGQFTVDIAH